MVALRVVSVAGHVFTACEERRARVGQRRAALSSGSMREETDVAT